MAKRERGEEHPLDTLITKLQEKCRLDSWRDFVDDTKVPDNLLPAVMTGRPELVKLAKARALTAEECRVVYDMIAGYIETNNALQQHAREVAAIVSHWLSAFTGLQRVGHRIERFAQFQRSDSDSDEDADHA